MAEKDPSKPKIVPVTVVATPDPPFVVEPGDQSCKSCTGIMYLTNTMRDAGQKPVCLGVSKMMKQQVAEEVMKAIDEKQHAKPKPDCFICVGYSRVSGRMERKGQSPSCLDGLAIVRYPTQSKTQTSEQPSQERRHQPVLPPMPVMHRNPLDVGQEISEKLAKSAVNNLVAISSFWQNTLTDFPAKLERSATSIATSMPGTPARIGRAITKMRDLIFGEDEDN